MNMNQQYRINENSRVSSLDVLRGFSMFWLIGGAAIIEELARHDFIRGMGMAWLDDQMSHRGWIGLNFFDLVFPFFIFASGATLPYSIARMKSKGISNHAIIFKSFGRALVLITIGIIYNEWTAHSFSNPRLCSVLGQIGVSYFISTSIFILNRSRNRLLGCTIIILSLIAILQVTLPGSSLNEQINPNNSINSLIDSLLPGRLYYDNFDPEGPLNWISASSVCLLGAWTSSQILVGQKNNHRFRYTAKILLIVGICFIATGLLADPYYPIIKKLWTSSFCLLSGGISILMYVLLYSVIEIKNLRKPFYIFKMIGANSLLAYVAQKFFGYSQFTKAFAKHVSENFSLNSAFFEVLITTLVTLLILDFMYRKKLFIKA